MTFDKCSEFKIKHSVHIQPGFVAKVTRYINSKYVKLLSLTHYVYVLWSTSQAAARFPSQNFKTYAIFHKEDV